MQQTAIEALDESGNVVHYFATQSQAVEAGYSQSAISKCLAGERAEHKGYRWRRASPATQALAMLDEFLGRYERRYGHYYLDGRSVDQPIIADRFVEWLPEWLREHISRAEALRQIYG